MAKRKTFSAAGDTSARTAVNAVANALRATSLSMEQGGFIGSEEMLSKQFGVSTPTLRAAARLLEHEQVIKVQRGTRGGYFALHPKVETISHSAALYLRSNPASIEDTWVLVKTLAPIIIDLAIKSERLPELEEFATVDTTNTSYDDFLDGEKKCMDLIVDLSDNIPIKLVWSILSEIGISSIPVGVVEITSEERDYQERRKELVGALLRKDRDYALECFLKSQRKVKDEIVTLLVSKS